MDAIEQEILTLDRIAVAIKFWRYRAKRRLLELRGNRVPNSHLNFEVSPITLTTVDLQFIAHLSGNVQKRQDTSQNQKTGKSWQSSSVIELFPQHVGSFISLRFGPSERYKRLVCDQNWSTKNIRSHQVSGFSHRNQFSAKNYSIKLAATVNTDGDAQLNDPSNAASLPLSSHPPIPQSRSDLSGNTLLRPALPLNSRLSLTPTPRNTSKMLQSELTAANSSWEPAFSNCLRLDPVQSDVPNTITASISAPTRPSSSMSHNCLQSKSSTAQTSSSALDNSVFHRQLLQQARDQPGQRQVPNPFLAREVRQIRESTASISQQQQQQRATCSNVFIEAAAVQAHNRTLQLPLSHDEPPSEDANDGQVGQPPHPESRAFYPASNESVGTISSSLGNKFLVKKIAQQSNQNTRRESPHRPNSLSLDCQRFRRRSSSSVEVIDDRPRQRRRIEPDRVLTPPLNSNPDCNKVPSGNVKIEERSPASLLRERVNTGEINEYDAAPRSTKSILNNDTRMKKSRTLSPFRQLKNTRSQHEFQGSPSHGLSRDSLTNKPATPTMRSRSRSSSSSNSDSQSKSHPRSRTKTGTPSIIAAGALSPSPSRDRNKRPIRRTTQSQRQPGSYRTPAYRPLTPVDRVTLELRFCAQVAKIIGSKCCVSEAPVPYDNVPIFQRFRQRFGGKNAEDGEDEENGKYLLASRSS